jgi:serine/threonine-protein kinase
VSAVKVCPQCEAEYPANARFCEIDGTALRGGAPASDLVGSIIADRYHVMRKLGQGGMGQVYLVEHVKMGRKSALKIMHPGLAKDADAVTRFNREAANASRISHPNVAAVYDFGESADGVIYLAMEFVDGQPLTRIIEESGGLTLKRSAEITRQTAEALAVAHDMEIVHRDLKPDNIMIGKTRDGDDLVKVVDFGIAKTSGNAAQKLTKTGNVVGTPDYMSPEQLSGDALDYRSDIYSLGLVTFNMLTGTLPFPSDSPQESMIMRLTDRPKTLAEMRPDVGWPPEVQTVMDRALERKVALRYQQAKDFARDLARAIDRMGAPVPPTRVARPTTLTPGSAPTVAVSGLGRGSQPANSSPTSAPPPSRQIPVRLVGGIAVLLVVSAVLYRPILNRSKKPPAADATQSTPAASGSLPGNTTAPNPDAAHRSDAGQRPPGRSGTKSAPQNSTIDIDKELSSAEIESKSDDPGSARAALRRIEKIEGRLVLAGDIARAGLVKYEAWATLGDERKACSALTDVKDRATGTPYKSKVDALLLGC